MKLTLALATLWFAVTLNTGLTPAAGNQLNDVTLAIKPSVSSIVLGEHFDLSISVTNNGAGATPPLVVHLDITDPNQSTSVDPEDWTASLSQSIGEVGPGETVAVDWTVQPVTAGDFAAYAVALSPGVDTISASNVLEVHVADQRTISPGGVLPVAIAAPTLIGLLLLAQIRLTRPTRRL